MDKKIRHFLNELVKFWTLGHGIHKFNILSLGSRVGYKIVDIWTVWSIGYYILPVA